MSCKDRVYKYLCSQNRPYSVNDIFQNLNNEFSRAIVQKALDELTLENKIKEKIYGKQKVYSIGCILNSNELELEAKEIDVKIEEIYKIIEFVEEKLKDTEREMLTFEKNPSTANALKEKVKIEETLKKLSKEVNSFPQHNFQYKAEEKNELDIICKNLSKEYKRRKLICTDALNTILENYPQKIEALLADVGIETI